jgi:hypothetical protein
MRKLCTHAGRSHSDNNNDKKMNCFEVVSITVFLEIAGDQGGKVSVGSEKSADSPS